MGKKSQAAMMPAPVEVVKNSSDVARIEATQMTDLLEEMKRCKTIGQCIEVATTDAYGDEQVGSWLTCIEEMFGEHHDVMLLGEKVKIERFDTEHGAIIAICKKGKLKARVTLDSIVFPKLTATEKLWLKAWGKYSAGFN